MSHEHDHILDDLIDFADGTLDQEAADALEQRLAAPDEDARALNDTRGLIADLCGLGDAIGDNAPEIDMVDAVMASVSKLQETTETTVRYDELLDYIQGRLDAEGHDRVQHELERSQAAREAYEWVKNARGDLESIGDAIIKGAPIINVSDPLFKSVSARELSPARTDDVSYDELLDYMDGTLSDVEADGIETVIAQSDSRREDAEWLKSLRGKRVYHVHSWRDPMPVLAEMWFVIWRRFSNN